MSAGDTSLKANRDRSLLAPKFRSAVEAGLADCEAAGLDAMVWEGHRSPELAALYYQRGRTIKPPARPVTNARTALYTWHGYGLAVDIIHRTKFWDAGDAWFRQMADLMIPHGLKAGLDWKFVDPPHIQWGKCKASPSDRARELLAAGGEVAVWQAVGAA